MVFSYVIVNITIFRRPFVFSQSYVQISASLTNVRGLAVAAFDLVSVYCMLCMPCCCIFRSAEKNHNFYDGSFYLSFISMLKASCKVAALRETIASIRRKSDWMMQKVNFNNYLP